VGTILVLGTAAGARAHTVSPDEIVAGLRAPSVHEAYDVEDVSRLEGLPRLLLVRVGPRWREVPAEQRRAIAENWARSWEHAVPQGIVSIVDARSGDAVVNFDALGNARLVR
jgi:hypothetical protein